MTDNIISRKCIEKIRPGSILMNSETEEDYGVFVNHLPNNRIVVFRIQDKSYPVFSKMNINSNIVKVGHINEYKYSDLREELLKYYRTRNISKSEEAILSELMIEAFPLGIPLYRPNIPLPINDINRKLQTEIQPGSRLELHTTEKSSISNLDGEIVYVVDKKPEGIWVVRPSTELSPDKFHFLFYSNPSIPTFAGMSRVKVIHSKNIDESKLPIDNPKWRRYKECYSNLNNDNELCTNININGKRLKVNPTNMNIIFPREMDNNIYNPEKDNLLPIYADKSEFAFLDDEDEEVINTINRNSINLSDNELIGGAKTSKNVSYDDYIQDGDDDDLDKNIVKNLDLDNYEDEEIIVETDDFDNTNNNTTNNNTTTTNNNTTTSVDVDNSNIEYSDLDDETDSEYEVEEELELDEDEDERVIEVVEKVELIPRAEEEKEYKDKIQRGELIKYELEKQPFFLRNDINIQNTIIKRVNKIINIKNNTQDDKGNFKLMPENYSPLVEQYMSGNFKNKHLIPIVIDYKKIYINPKSRITEEDYNQDYHYTTYFFKELENLNYLTEHKKRTDNIDYYTIINNLLESVSPYHNIDNTSDKGVFIRLGQNTKDLTSLSLDTLVMKYCNLKQNMCQSFEITHDDIDYHMYLGPIPKYSTKSDNNDNQEENKENILNVIDDIDTIKKGEELNIVGFLRMPLNLPNDELTIEEIYSNYDVKIINLEKDEPVNTLNYHNNIVIYLLPLNGIMTNAELEETMHSIIPTFYDIINYYEDTIKKTTNMTDIIKLLNMFEYNYQKLNINQFNRITSLLNEGISKYQNLVNKIDSKYSNYLKSIEENREDNKEENTTSTKINNSNIDDDLIRELEKLYLDTYIDFGSNVDTNSRRMEWVNKQRDGGRYLYHYLLLEHYKKLEPEKMVEVYSEELTINEQHLGQLNDARKNTHYSQSQTGNCQNRLGKPRILRYKSINELENDNGRQVIDMKGDIVLPGDYAIVKDNGEISIYKRTDIGGTEMWIKESKNVLYRLIEEERNACQNNIDNENEYNIGKTNDEEECAYDIDSLECNPQQKVLDDMEINKVEERINSIRDEISYLKQVLKTQRQLEVEVRKFRQEIIKYRNLENTYYRIEEAKAIELDKEMAEMAIIRKPCIHFKVVEYFFKIRNVVGEDRYRLAETIINKFQSTEQLDLYTISSDENENYVKCNICNQSLFCKHYLLGIKQLNNMGKLDEDEIVNIYGIEGDFGFSCRICGEMIINSDVRDLNQFVRNLDKPSGRDIHRSVLEEEEIVELTPMEEYLQLLDDTDLFKAELYIALKQLIGIENKISIEDEREMVNFIKSFPFNDKKYYAIQIAAIKKEKPTDLIYKIADIYAKQDICYVIASRFLIMMQTSKKEYIVKNKLCKANYYGYPLIDDKTETNGVDLMACIFTQLVSDNRYKTIIRDITDINKVRAKLIKETDKLVSEDEYIKNRLLNTLALKDEKINFTYDFQNSISTVWKDFRPQLGKFKVDWIVDKKFMKDDVNKVSAISYPKMYNVAIQNMDYYSLSIMKIIDNIVSLEDAESYLTRNSIFNSCCLGKIKDDKKGKSSMIKYIDFFSNKDNDINAIYQTLHNTQQNIRKLRGKVPKSLLNIITILNSKPSYDIIPLHFNVIEEEIKSLYLTYIDTGVNMGNKHIFDIYGRCILSNIIRDDIEKQVYNTTDYKRLVNIIHNTNSKEIDIVEPIDIVSLDYATNILSELKSINQDNAISSIIDKLITLWNSDKMEREKELRAWANLNSIISQDIDSIVEKITSKSSIQQEIRNYLNNLGELDNKYNEYNDDEDDMKKQNYFRYKTRETELKKIFKTLIYSISFIKNGKYEFVKNENDIKRQDYKFIFPFIKERSLFSKIYKEIETYYKVSNKIIGQDNNKYISAENTSNIIHYLIILSFVKMIELYSDKIISDNIKENPENVKPPRKMKQRGGFQDDDDDDDIYNKNSDSNNTNDTEDNSNNEFDRDTMDEFMDDIPEEEDIKLINFSEDIDKSKSSKLNTVIKFITIMLNKLENDRILYNKLTRNEISLIVKKETENQQRRNLSKLQFLKKEGLEEQSKIIMLQLQFKQIDYSQLADIVDEMGMNSDLIIKEDVIDDTEVVYENEAINSLGEEDRDDAIYNRMMDREDYMEQNQYVYGEEDDDIPDDALIFDYK